MSTPKLLPCPFCGGRVKEWKSDTPVSFSFFDIFHKKGCFLYRKGVIRQGADDISCFTPRRLAAWNRRAGEKP